MASEEDLDVEDYLAGVERVVAKQQRWSVDHNEIHLNFFSFNKLLIYKDLDPASWPEEKKPARTSAGATTFWQRRFRKPIV